VQQISWERDPYVRDDMLEDLADIAAFESLSLDEGADDCAAGGGPPLRCGWEPLQLTSLSLRGWSAITHLELSAAERLQALQLGECKQLISLKLSTSSLTRLSAAACTLLLTVELSCPSLRQLALNLCKRLQLLHLACPSPLEVLTLHSCREFGVPALSAVLQVCGQTLTHLDLNGALSTEDLTPDDLH